MAYDLRVEAVSAGATWRQEQACPARRSKQIAAKKELAVAMYDNLKVRRVLVGKSEWKNGERVQRKFKITSANKSFKPFTVRSIDKIGKAEALILASVKMHNTNEMMKNYVVSNLRNRIGQIAAGGPDYIDYNAARWMNANKLNFMGDQRANLDLLTGGSRNGYDLARQDSRTTMRLSAGLRSNVIEELRRQHDSLSNGAAPLTLSHEAADWLRSHRYNPEIDPGHNLALLQDRGMNATLSRQSGPRYDIPMEGYYSPQPIVGQPPLYSSQQYIDRPPSYSPPGAYYGGQPTHAQPQPIERSSARLYAPYQPHMVYAEPDRGTRYAAPDGPYALPLPPYQPHMAEQRQPYAEANHGTERAVLSPTDFDPHLQNPGQMPPERIASPYSRPTLNERPRSYSRGR